MSARVAYVGGNFAVSHSTEVHYALSFEANGCDVARLDERNLDVDALVRDCKDGRYDLLLYTRVWNLTNPRFVELLSDPPGDLVTAAVHLDIWRDLERAEEVETSPMFRAQHVFTADGDADEFFAARGVNHHWLPAAVVDPTLVGETVPGTPDPERWPYKVAFVGSYAYHHEWPQRPALIDALAAHYRDDFVLVGGGKRPRGYRGRWIPTLREQALNDFYATVSVTVGDSCFAHRGTRYFSDRFFEAWGRGGYVVFPWIDALAELVADYPSYDADAFDTVGLRDAVDGALGDAFHRDATRAHLGALVRAEHTYTQRAQSLLDTLGLT